MTIPKIKKLSFGCFVETGSGDENYFYDIGNCDLKLYYITFNSSQSFGEHGHNEDRITFIRSGKGKLFFSDSEILLFPGDSFHIEPNIPHRIEVLGNEPISIIELVILPQKTGESNGGD